MKEIIDHSELTCPECGHTDRLKMPTDFYQWFYECPACHILLKPKESDCCVFCSYGSVPCPPVQSHNAGQAIGSCHCE